MPIEPALLASAGRMPERASMERPEGRMPKGSVRRDGMGNPEPAPKRPATRHGLPRACAGGSPIYNRQQAVPQARPPPKPQTTTVLSGPIRPVRQASSRASGIEPLEVLP
jgi:hypothetical protein